MKILNAEQVRALDNFTIQNKPIKSIDLMENAARQCTSWLLENYANTQGFYIFCGRGNNGGDGLAIARQLLDVGMSVHVFVIAGTKPGSKDFEINLSRLTKGHSEPIILNTVQDIPNLIANYALVDALIGSGLKQPTYGLTAEIIKHINTLSNPVISIDIASGLFMESNEQNNYSTIIQATDTLSLELPKLAFLFPTNDFIVGNWHLLPIGLSQEYL